MASNDAHHDEPFDDGTKVKLFIYKSYLQAWLQVFIHTNSFVGRPLQFFDFFSGPGEDAEGHPGSPIILMRELEANRPLIESKGRHIAIFFNDYDAKKAEHLRQLCIQRNYHWQPTVAARDFAEAYAERAGAIGRGPSLVFLDQFGVKFVTKQIFTEIAQKPQTDLLFFFASGHQRRFDGEFSNELHVPLKTPYTLAHRVVAEQFRKWAPAGYFVGSFSIKKGSNIYGLIFGSGHPLGMYKFLQTAWSIDPKTGEANFEIEADCAQATFFEGFKPTKIELMRDDLLALIRARKLVTDGQVVLHCITGGVLPGKVAPEVYRKLKAEGTLTQGKTNIPRYSHEALSEPRALDFA